MMKLFKILIPIFFLFFSSSVFAEFPTSLFGVELDANAKQYKKNNTTINKDKHLCNKQKKPNQKLSGEIEGYTSESKEIKFMKNHPLFDTQCIYVNEKFLITSISGSTSFNFFNNYDSGNINRYGLKQHVKNHFDVISTLSNLYDIPISDFKDTHSFKQSEIKNDDEGYQFSPQTLNLLNILNFRINDKNSMLYLYSNVLKIKDAQPQTSNLNSFIGSGMIMIGLVDESDEMYNEMKNWQKESQKIQIKKDKISKYVNLMLSNSSSF